MHLENYQFSQPTWPENSDSLFLIKYIRKNLSEQRNKVIKKVFIKMPSCSINSHVVSHVVLPSDVVVEAVRDVVKFSLGKATNKTLCEHFISQGFFFISELTKCINYEPYMSKASYNEVERKSTI